MCLFVCVDEVRRRIPQDSVDVEESRYKGERSFLYMSSFIQKSEIFEYEPSHEKTNDLHM